MMLLLPTNPDFSAFNKSNAQSFVEQKKLIKNICQGKTVLCPTCGQPLKLTAPGKSGKAGKQGKDKEQTVQKTGVSCAKGCTNIELDFAL
jgi:hypothetical protein